MAKIAFLGLGAMGARMASNLLAAGHDLTVWNRSPSASAPLVASGARLAQTPRQAAEGAEIVVAMVRDDKASRTVWLDPRTGALAGLSEGALAIDSSTLTLQWVLELGKIAAKRGVAFLDAPVAGSRPQAEAKQLIYFVGGEASAVTRAEPVLMAMGGAVHHAGDTGSGAGVKLMVNALFGIQLAAMAELISLTGKLGLDSARAVEILGATPVCSPAAKVAAAGMLASNYVPMFPIDLVEKDFRYVISEARQAGAKAPVSAVTRRVFEEAKKRGLGMANITAVAKLYN